MAPKTKIDKRNSTYKDFEKRMSKKRKGIGEAFKRLNKTIPSKKKASPLTDTELSQMRSSYDSCMKVLNEGINEVNNEYNRAQNDYGMYTYLKQFKDNPALINSVPDPNQRRQISDGLRNYNYYRNSYERLNSVKQEYIYMTKIRKTLSKDIRVIDYAMKSQSKPTVTKLYENSRSVRVVYDLDSAAKFGGAMSTRFKLELKDRNPGFFTESKVQKPFDEQLVNLTLRILNEYGDAGTNLNSNIAFFAAEALRRDREFSNKLIGNKETLLAEAYDAASFATLKLKMKNAIARMSGVRVLENGYYNAMDYNSLLPDAKFSLDNAVMLVDKLNSPEALDAFIDFAGGVSSIINEDSINKDVGISPAAKMDKRNAAASMIAELLDCKDLIANSVNMRVKTGEKGYVSGTFMENAKGRDFLSKKSADMEAFNLLTPNKVEDSLSLKKDIANLQVLDYILGNPDRHTGNVFYKFDENGNIIGLQGIDNDTCLGNKNHTALLSGINLENMSVITAKTAAIVLNIKPDELRTMLYGYDLTDAEVNAAINRVDNLKNKIIADKAFYADKPPYALYDGRIKIVDDNELDKLSLFYELSAGNMMTDPKGKRQGKINKNIFTDIATIASNANSLFKNSEAMKEDALQKYGELIHDQNKLGRLLTDIEIVDKKTFNGSENFNNVKKQMTEVRKIFKENKNPLVYKGKTVFNIDMKAIRTQFKAYSDAVKLCDTYLNGKDKKSIDKKSKDSNAYKRYYQVKEAKRIAQDGMKALNTIVSDFERRGEYLKQMNMVKEQSKWEMQQIANKLTARNQELTRELNRNRGLNAPTKSQANVGNAPAPDPANLEAAPVPANMEAAPASRPAAARNNNKRAASSGNNNNKRAASSGRNTHKKAMVQKTGGRSL